MLFPAKNMDARQFYNNIAGVSIAFLGCVLYGNIKYASQHGREDCVDCSCPGVVAQANPPPDPDPSNPNQSLAAVTSLSQSLASVTSPSH